jgi:glucose/arabinose dehydrogenase
VKRTFLILFAVIFLIVGMVFFFQRKVGNLGPVLLPAIQPTTSSTSPNPTTDTLNSDTQLSFLQLPTGFSINYFAQKTPGARDLQLSPGGTVLVSLMNSGKVVALPDTNSDGKADQNREVLTGLNKPHGLAFHDGKLFVAEVDKVSRYNWDEKNLTATFDKKIVDLPKNAANHTSRSLLFGSDGSLYISIGSTCNVCLEPDERFAAVVKTDADGNNPQVFAKGLRNAPFLAENPDTKQVWVTEMGRDLLGDNIPPDEINILQSGADYGWPYCYGQKIFDTNFNKESASYCDHTSAPTFEIPAHSAPLGLAFISDQKFPADWKGDLLVAYHGSWNRSVPTGYKVVRLKVEGNTITGQEDFLTGFLKGSQAAGRPVDVTFDSAGSLYVSDDKAGVVYLIRHK